MEEDKHSYHYTMERPDNMIPMYADQSHSSSRDFGEYNVKDNSDDQNGRRNLIINYLPHDIDDLALKSLFDEFGDIVMTRVIRDKNTKKSLGYGFVKFAEDDEALAAIEKMNGFPIGHKVLKVSVARPASMDIRNCKLYVTNLPQTYNEREVVELFQEFGPIIECRVLKEKNSRLSKGVAFVQFNVKAQANSALALNGCELEGSSRPLVVKYAEDQHKKKELSRLQTLTTNAYRMNTMMGNNYNQRPPMELKPDPMSQPYYFQQGMNPNMYNPQSPVVSNSMYMPSPVGNNYPKGPGKSRKGGMSQNPYEMQMPETTPPWYNAIPPQMTYMPGSMSPHMMDQRSPHIAPMGEMDNAHLHQMSMSMMNSLTGSPPQTNRRTSGRSQMGMDSGFGSMGEFVTLTISNLPHQISPNSLADMFSRYGRVTQCHLEQDPSGRNGRHSLIGKVQMDDLAQADFAAQVLNGSVLIEGTMPIQITVSLGANSAALH